MEIHYSNRLRSLASFYADCCLIVLVLGSKQLSNFQIHPYNTASTFRRDEWGRISRAHHLTRPYSRVILLRSLILGINLRIICVRHTEGCFQGIMQRVL